MSFHVSRAILLAHFVVALLQTIDSSPAICLPLVFSSYSAICRLHIPIINAMLLFEEVCSSCTEPVSTSAIPPMAFVTNAGKPTAALLLMPAVLKSCPKTLIYISSGKFLQLA